MVFKIKKNRPENIYIEKWNLKTKGKMLSKITKLPQEIHVAPIP